MRGIQRETSAGRGAALQSQSSSPHAYDFRVMESVVASTPRASTQFAATVRDIFAAEARMAAEVHFSAADRDRPVIIQLVQQEN